MANIIFTRDEELTNDELLTVEEVFQSVEDDALGDEPTLDVIILESGAVRYELTLTRHLSEEEARKVYETWVELLPEIDADLEFSMDIADPAELDDFDEVSLCEEYNTLSVLYSSTKNIIHYISSNQLLYILGVPRIMGTWL